MNALQLKEEVMNAFEKRDIALLSDLLDDYPNMGAENLRFKAHYNAKKQLISGELEKSLSAMVESVEVHGPHVCLLADIVGVAYLLNDIRLMNNYFKILMSEYEKSKVNLSSITVIQVSIFIGKIYELRGEIYQAEQYYQHSFENSSNTRFFISACSQLVRIKSFLNKGEEVAELYNLIMLKKKDFNESDFELNHAILFMETRIFGSDFAGKRLNHIIDGQLPHYDKKQMICHFLEELFWNNEPLKDSFISKILGLNILNELNNYERAVFSQFFEVNEEENDKVDNSILDEMKCLALVLKKAEQSPKKDAYIKKLTFILNGLSKESRILLENKWQSLIFTKQALAILVDTVKEDVQIEHMILNKAKSKQLFKILIHAKNKNFIQSEILAFDLFGISNYDEVSYHRLRMVINRLNLELKVSCGIAKFFILKFNQLEINHDVKLIIT